MMGEIYQQWRDLLFLHWKTSAQSIENTLPKPLFVDTFQGDAYITIIPFFMPRVSPFKYVPIPGLNNFLEVNVRTYVRDQHGTPGIWFYSLDINSLAAALVARHFFHLPYYAAHFTVDRSAKGKTVYEMRRGETHMQVSYQQQKEKGSLASGLREQFLIERYVLFTAHGQNLYRQEVRHKPYPLSSVNLEQCTQTMITTPRPKPDYVDFSPGVDVELLPMRKCSARAKESHCQFP